METMAARLRNKTLIARVERCVWEGEWEWWKENDTIACPRGPARGRVPSAVVSTGTPFHEKHRVSLCRH